MDRNVDEGIVRVVAVWQAVAGREQDVREIVGELAARTRAEPGCRSFEVREARDQPGWFVLLEEYAGDVGRARHVASDHFLELVLERAVPLLARRDVQVCDVLPIRLEAG